MSRREALFKEIEHKAGEYAKREDTELERLFWEEWLSVEPEAGAPTHGVGDEQFWEGFRKRLVAGIVKNRDAGIATIGAITNQVLIAVEGLGVDLTLYKVPVAIFVGIVARSVWDWLEVHAEAKGYIAS